MGFGKQGARNIDQRLMGEDRWTQLFPEFKYSQKVPAEPSESPRHEPHALAARLRAGSDDEVVVGFSAEEALDESNRCLRCDVKTHMSVS